MARIYSRARGQHGSTRPSKKSVPSWTRYKAKEVELLMQKLAKEGHTSSEIGIMLRDSYGIPDVRTLTGKTISGLLKEKNLLPKIPEDLMSLIRRNVQIRKHLELNKHDESANRGLIITESKIKRLVKYYIRVGKLPKDFKFDEASLRLLTGG